jgi:hypothetical protein
MLPALRLSLLTLAVLLIPATAASAKGLSVAIPAEGQVAVAVASGAKSVKVKSAPAGVTVAGGVKKGRLAVGVVRPRGVTASGKVVLTVGGKLKGVKTFPKALEGGKVAGCGDLAALLGKRLKGTANIKGLGAVLAAKLCGKAAPAGAAEVLGRLGLGAAPSPGPSGPVAGGGSGSISRPGGPARPGATATPTPTPTPPPPAGKRACDDDADNDGDGQTDWEDPGCSDAGDTTENSEVAASAECAASSFLAMAADDPTAINVGINPGCGVFWEAEIQVAPGVASCTANNDYECKVYDPFASASLKAGERDGVDMTLQLKGPVDCAKKATIALYRLDGRAVELQEPVESCKTLPPPAPKCDNGKDDDGDGLVDSRDSAGTTEPDPGCGGVGDMTESSEVPTPESCQVQVGYFGTDKSFTGLLTSGCGVLKGAWFRPPGTPKDCLWAFGEDDWAACPGGALKASTVGVTFPLTNQDLALGTHLTADYTCRDVTVALIREDDSVMSDTVPFCG